MLSDVVEVAAELTEITTGVGASVPLLETVTGEIKAVNLVARTAVPDRVKVPKAVGAAGVPTCRTMLPVVPAGTEALMPPPTTRQSGGIWNIYILSDADALMV
jgi:hypothetical protein